MWSLTPSPVTIDKEPATALQNDVNQCSKSTGNKHQLRHLPAQKSRITVIAAWNVQNISSKLETTDTMGIVHRSPGCTLTMLVTDQLFVFSFRYAVKRSKPIVWLRWWIHGFTCAAVMNLGFCRQKRVYVVWRKKERKAWSWKRTLLLFSVNLPLVPWLPSEVCF